MAKKKGTFTSPFVPAEEQPYSIPDNWCWIILGNAVNIKRGASPRPIKSYITDEFSGVNWIKIGDTDTGKYVTSVKEKITQQGANKSVFVEKGTLLLSNSMSFGRPYILNVEGCIHDGWLAITPSDCFDKEFLYYTLLASNWYFEQVAVGTAVRNLNSERVANTPVPLPPLPEQHRIVTRIESLFAKLDEAKEKAQAVVDGFELRKSAILHKAFTGELTERWRKERGVGLDSWAKVELIDVLTEKPRNGYSPKPVNYVTPYKSMTLSATTSGVFKDEYFKYIDETIPEDSYLWLKPGDILIQRANSLDKVGTSAIYTGQEHEFIYPDLMMKLQVVETASPQFVAYSLKRDEIFVYFRANAAGTAGNMPKINQKTVSRTPLNLPTFDEQIEIVRILENLFAKMQQAKEAAEAVLAQIDTMKKAILARAFRGELGTNDPAEEWAGELLKTVL